MTDDDELMALSAVRYCLGRQTYMSGVGSNWMHDKFSSFSPQTRVTMLADVIAALAKGHAGNPAIDAPLWRDAARKCLVTLSEDEMFALRRRIEHDDGMMAALKEVQ